MPSVGPRTARRHPTKKAQALLAYLALTPGQTHPRDKLAARLRGEMAPGPARNALRLSFFVLRKALGEAVRDRRTGRTEATEHLETAASLFRELDMRPWDFPLDRHLPAT